MSSNQIAALAARGDRRDIVNNLTLRRLSEQSFIDMIRLGIRELNPQDTGADNYNEIAVSAAIEGHLDIVIDMVQLGADNYNEIAIGAAGEGHLDIVEDMIQRGADDYNEIAIRQPEEIL